MVQHIFPVDAQIPFADDEHQLWSVIESCKLNVSKRTSSPVVWTSILFIKRIHGTRFSLKNCVVPVSGRDSVPSPNAKYGKLDSSLYRNYKFLRRRANWFQGTRSALFLFNNRLTARHERLRPVVFEPCANANKSIFQK